MSIWPGVLLPWKHLSRLTDPGILSSSYISFKYLGTTVRLAFKSSSYNTVIAFRGLADHVVGRLRPGIRCVPDVLLRVPSMTEHKKLNPRAELFLLYFSSHCTSLEYFKSSYSNSLSVCTKCWSTDCATILVMNNFNNKVDNSQAAVLKIVVKCLVIETRNQHKNSIAFTSA